MEPHKTFSDYTAHGECMYCAWQSSTCVLLVIYIKTDKESNHNKKNYILKNIFHSRFYHLLTIYITYQLLINLHFS